MIFSRKKDEVLEPYTVEQCTSCNATKKRKFAIGDYVFKTLGKCTACNVGQVTISKVFGEPVK